MGYTSLRYRLDPISTQVYTDMVKWSVVATEDCATWIDELSEDDQAAIDARTQLLAERGPALGRPVVDTIEGSRHPNMKELRVTSGRQSAIRILFAFDPERRAVLLVGGDKAGNWERWYRDNIPLADDRFDEWLKEVNK